MAYRLVLLLAPITALYSSLLLAQDIGKTVIKHGVITEDLYVAGGRIHILGEVKGDVVAAGGQIFINRQVQSDVIVAGGAIDIRAEVLDDVRAAGGSITIDSHVEGDVVAAGGILNLAPGTKVGGRALLAGGDVRVAGSIAKSLRGGAGTITISGEIEGDVELGAREIIVLPTARIRGNLTYLSPREASIAPEAQIGGTVSYISVELPKGISPIQKAAFGGLFFLSLLVAGLVLFALFPNFTVSAARTIGSDPWKSLGLGLALLVTTPFASSLLLVTILGIPLGLAGFAIYFVWLLAGFLTAVFFVGDRLVRLPRQGPEVSRGWRVMSLIGAFAMLGLIQFLPVVGVVVLFLALVFGLGAWTLHAYRGYATGHP